jgi:hypothetical protein
MGRLFFWLGDLENFLHRRYGAAYSFAVFCVVWLLMTVVVHFGGMEGSFAVPHRWPAAVALGLVLACICSLGVELSRSRH